MEIDDIIDSCRTLYKKSEIVATDLIILRYRCDEHQYTIHYSEELEKAKYVFDGQEGFIDTDIPLKQRNYYLDSGYWKTCD